MGANDEKNFVVDLDGTLLKTDSLWELFFQALAQGRLAPLAWLLANRATFKKRLAQSTELDLAYLPWNEEVIDLAKARKRLGERIWLATAADEILAQKVVGKFDFFDGYVASNGRRNLRGEAKAAALVVRFGSGGFAYVGDSPIDLAVWRSASEAVVVGDPSLVERARTVNAKVMALGPGASLLAKAAAVFKLLRVYQWVKNCLLFLPLMMAHLFTLASLGETLAAFLAFSLLSSCGYVLNDLLDIPADRKHPEKRRRALASGALDPPIGAWLFFLTLLFGLFFSWLLGGLFFGLAWLYLLATVLYSLKLKTVLILDVVVLTLLYCLRVLAGAAAIDVAISQWLLSFSFFDFAALCLKKRLGETVNAAAPQTSTTPEAPESSSRRPYGREDMAFFLTLTSGCVCCAVLTLAIYVGEAVALEFYASPRLLSLFCPVLFYWLVRLLKLAQAGKMPYDPVFFTLKDKASWICLALGVAIFIVATVGL
jgi:4-hydroxybenzoate polyprenyltransferase/phosphoglycolate phosphatase-like HAD superfamily hydrolase